jgi:hypothetical protein
MDNREMRTTQSFDSRAVSGAEREQVNRRRTASGTQRTAFVMLTLIVAISSIGFNGCGGGTKGGVLNGTRLNGKRLFILLPKQEGFKLQNPDAYAYSRGIAEESAQARIHSEMKSQFPDELGQRYDSNTVLNYDEHAIGGSVPLNAVSDFTGASSSWKWDEINRAGKEGAVDYLLVLHTVEVSNQKPRNEFGRGRETISASFHLIDPLNKVNVSSTTVSISIDDPRIPSDSYVLLARQVASKLPFLNSSY